MSQIDNVREAYPGFCSLCHTQIFEIDGMFEVKPGVFRPKLKGPKPNFRIKNLILSNESIMTVSLCDKCEDLKPEDCGKLMESEMRGWRREWEEMMGEEDSFLKDAYLNNQAELSVKDRLNKPWTEDEKKKITKPDKKNMNLPVSKEK